jgi:hypothetical protein
VVLLGEHRVVLANGVSCAYSFFVVWGEHRVVLENGVLYAYPFFVVWVSTVWC